MAPAGVATRLLHAAAVLSLCHCASAETGDVVYLTQENFERLTQAATGATTGVWLVGFVNNGAHGTRFMRQLQKLRAALFDEAEVRVPVNVGIVDLAESPTLGTRFHVVQSTEVRVFDNGRMFYYNGRDDLDQLLKFAQGAYRRAGSVQVPPEPHIPDSHERTFMIAIGAVMALAGVLYVVDLALQRSRRRHKRRRV